jgi:hypothetical protein
MRASDLQRQQTVEELARHCSAGRLSMEEYGERLTKALSAQTFEELDALLADLPFMRISHPLADRPTGSLDRAQDGHAEESDLDKLRLRAGAALALAVVALAIVAGLLASWLWALSLLAAWALGVAEGSLLRRRRP